jgi:hypothetical protein
MHAHVRAYLRGYSEYCSRTGTPSTPSRLLVVYVERIDAREGATRIHYRYIKHIPMCTQSTPRGRARAGRVGCARKHHARDTGRREQGGCAHARAVCSRSISHRCTRAHTRTHAQMRTNTHEHAHLHMLSFFLHIRALEETRTCTRARTRRRSKHRQGRATSVRAVYPCEYSEHPMREYSEHLRA